MKIFAHKGASGYAPENTLVAIKKAIEKALQKFSDTFGIGRKIDIEENGNDEE